MLRRRIITLMQRAAAVIVVVAAMVVTWLEMDKGGVMRHQLLGAEAVAVAPTTITPMTIGSM